MIFFGDFQMSKYTYFQSVRKHFSESDSLFSVSLPPNSELQ